MALTGLDVFKLLPKTNCKECDFPTCLAFAMRVAAKSIEPEKCPYLSEEAKSVLGASTAPPIRLVEIKTAKESVKIGEELVMFRHEKKFFHQAQFAVCINDSDNEKDILEKLDHVKKVNFNRAGETLKLDMIAVKNRSGDKEKFCSAVGLINGNIDFPLILISEDPETVESALGSVQGSKPLIFSANEENWEPMTETAKKFDIPMVITGNGDLSVLSDIS